MKLPGITPIGAAALLLVVMFDLWLATTIAMALLFRSTIAADRIEWNANLAPSPETAAKQKPIDAYREIVVRPVFFKSREAWLSPPPPPPVAVALPPPPPPVDPGLAVSGVMIRNGQRKAYVLSRSGANGGWVGEGEDFMGWKVVSVSGAGAKLEQAGRSINLSLYPE
jgi:hypothetical protein